jgi:hypothetical protein
MNIKIVPVRKPLLHLLGGLQIVICVGLGVLSLFFIGPEIKRADASASVHQQIGGAALIAGLYFIIGLLALRDIRASSLLAFCLSLFSTPLFAFLLLMSSWSTESAEAARPLFYYLAGNIVLFFSALWAILNMALSRKWLRTR